jgi:hypothetical protein
MLLVAQETIRRKSSGRPAEVSRAMVVDPWPFRLAVDQFKYLMKGEIAYTQFLATVDVSEV